MQTKDILTLLENLPGLLVWPEVQRLFPDPDAPLRADWMLPLYSIRALGGNELNMLPLAAALACVQMSIILVDDILDDDPRGHHLSMGSGRAANLALALQSAAHLVIKHGNLVPARIPAIGDCLQAMAFATAAGQEMDVGIISGEDDYWRLVRAKSTPFYATAFELGAIAAGATSQQRAAINKVGMLFGEIVQLLDDMDDAFASPAKPDWIRQNNNLVILFAKTADHMERDEFIELLKEIHEPDKLVRAQGICIRAGSVSYCIYQMVSRIGQVRECLKQSDIPFSDPILNVFRQQLLPLKQLLHRIDVAIPSEKFGYIGLMFGKKNRSSIDIRRPDGFLAGLSMLVLGICLYYSLSYVFSVPYLGFVISGDWTVTSLESICGEDISQCAIGGTWLQPDDQLVKIGDLDFLDYETNQWASPYENYTTGDTLSLIVERGGKQYQLQWKIPEPALVERVVRSLGMLIFLPYWLAGTIILLFLRPRDASWRLLTVLFLGLAIWLVAGVVSSYRFSGSVPIARSMSWVLSAVFVHFHLLVPSPLISPVSLKRSMVVVYAVAVLGATASLFGLISGTLAYGVLLISILGSLLLLAYHTIFRRADKSSRVASRLMLIGSGLAFGPSVLFWVLPGLLSLSTPGFLTTAFITAALPLQPFFYIYAIYKRSLGDLEFRVSRILASYSYLILFATGFVIVYMIAGQVLGYDNNLLSFSLLMSALLLAGAFLLQDRYLRVVRKMAYGTTHDPDHIVTLFANAIPQALNHQALADLLVKDMLPAMLIRQSALVVVGERGVRPIYATAIEEERLPAKQPVVQHLAETVKTYRSPELTPPDQYDWVRLALPVKLGEDILGAWLFGKRDPDDFYPLPDVTLLTTLASQIGVALQNIRLIEDLRQRADELQAANDELRELDKLKEEFIQNISHELRTPLTLVQGYVELMREGLLGEVNVEQKEALDIAFDRTLFTVRMVDDIISMQQALAEQMVMAPVDMAELAKKSLRMAELAGRKEQISADGTIRSRHQFELRLKGEVPLVMGARSRLGQVLDNLLGNAIKFSPDGGEIAIEIEPCYHRYDVGHSDLVPLPAVEISVRDQGVGIPASKIEHIWDRFFQVDGSSTRQFGGMGLGLSIVKEIVTSHEGFVWAESREGVGSIFRFVLPTQETFARVRKT